MKFQSVYKKNSWVAFLSILLMTGCKDVFDQPRIGAITSEEVWTNPDNIALYVNQFYGILPAWNRNEVYTEEAGAINSYLNAKQQTSSGFPDGIDWATAYTRIRAMNIFFQNINTNPALDANLKAKFEGQVYFFRAYQYYLLLKNYGGVPIVLDIQDPLKTEENMVARNSSLETFDYVVKSLDSAITLLPSTWGAADLGKVTKGAAMAVKGQVLLLKASPLFNPTQSHPEYWESAYQASKAALDELNANGMGLYTATMEKSYQNLFYDKTGAAKEMVLSVRYSDPIKKNGFQAAQRPLSVSAGAAGAVQPTWEMVQAYPMKNGMNIAEMGSGYKQAYFWKDRDPRFYATIVYNGAVYGFGTNTSRIQWMFPGDIEDGYMGDYQRSGFYTRKGIDTTLSKVDLSKQAFDWPIIRYAEVLLDVAECANETGNSALALNYIGLIRDRAGILKGSDGRYGLQGNVGSDKKATLEAIMKERQIEFAYEGKRFWDLRRRRMFSVLNAYGTWHAYGPYLADTKGTAADITGKGLENTTDIKNYFTALLAKPPVGVSRDSIIRAVTDYRKEAINRSADNQIKIPDTYYFWPINPNDIQKNSKLIQSVGWDNGTFNPILP